MGSLHQRYDFTTVNRVMPLRFRSNSVWKYSCLTTNPSFHGPNSVLATWKSVMNGHLQQIVT